MFLNPMWDNESQRIGLLKCTPTGYALRQLSDLVGCAGMLALLVAVAYWVYRGIEGTLRLNLVGLVAVPLAVGLLGWALSWLSWRLACRRGFHYDPDTREASWIEKGERRTYHWTTEP